MPKSFYAFISLVLTVFFLIPAAAQAQEYRTFETEYTEVYYERDEDIKRFLWRLSGREIDIYTYPGFAKNRIDRIVEKVQMLLDMYPERFKVDIFLRSRYERGDIAFYSKDNRSITVYADRITDNILAHELSHAMIYAHFKTPLPSKVQEILSQYVDMHLWSGE